MAKDVFISYKSEDFEQAEALRLMLESRSIGCWMAPQSIPGGSSYAAEIPPAIKACKVFLLVFTAKTQRSRWVSRELDQAINQSKVILPLMLEDCPMGDEFGFYLTNIQHYEGYRNREAVLERLITDIFAALGREVVPPPEVPAETPEPPTEAPAPARPRKTRPKREKASRKPLSKRAKTVAALIAVSALVMLAATVWMSLFSGVEIAGTRFERSAISVTLSQVTVTDADLKQLTKLTDCIAVSMEDCTFETDDLSALLTEQSYRLELVRCGVTDAMLRSMDLSQAPYLTKLNLNGNASLTDLRPLEAVAGSLTELEIADVRVSDPTVLSEFSKLTLLRIDRTGIADLQPLENLIYLEQLYASGNDIASLEGLQNITRLETVDLSNNRLSNVQRLSKSAQTLQNVYLDNNQLFGLSVVSTWTQLQTLSVDHNDLPSLAGLENCRRLKALSASYNLITVADSLPTENSVQYLDLSHNKLESAVLQEVLADDSLNVDLSHNQLKTLYVPANARFRTLAVQENGTSYMDVDAWNVSVMYLYTSWYGDREEPLFGIEFTAAYVADCPLDQRVAAEEAFPNAEFMTLQKVTDASVQRMQEIKI